MGPLRIPRAVPALQAQKGDLLQGIALETLAEYAMMDSLAVFHSIAWQAGGAMKRKLLIGLCILVALAVGWLIMYHGTIQNVFDEMYYGYRGIFPCFLYPANYNGFGFSRISPVERDMFAERDAFVEHSSK